MKQPLVSCIMPTANRHKYIPFAVDYFLQQDYHNTELIIIDDGKESIESLLPNIPNIRYFYAPPIGTIGLKRNYACEKAIGQIIVHWDDDDWYAHDWVSQQVNFLISSGADICGIRHIHHYAAITNDFWQGDALNRNNPILSLSWQARRWFTGKLSGRNILLKICKRVKMKVLYRLPGLKYLLMIILTGL
ncbi:glycosyltransferase family 2 protein [Pedobacter sp. NJ-S-72]